METTNTEQTGVNERLRSMTAEKRGRLEMMRRLETIINERQTEEAVGRAESRFGYLELVTSESVCRAEE